MDELTDTLAPLQQGTGVYRSIPSRCSSLHQTGRFYSYEGKQSELNWSVLLLRRKTVRTWGFCLESIDTSLNMQLLRIEQTNQSLAVARAVYCGGVVVAGLSVLWMPSFSLRFFWALKKLEAKKKLYPRWPPEAVHPLWVKLCKTVLY